MARYHTPLRVWPSLTSRQRRLWAALSHSFCSGISRTLAPRCKSQAHPCDRRIWVLRIRLFHGGRDGVEGRCHPTLPTAFPWSKRTKSGPIGNRTQGLSRVKGTSYHSTMGPESKYDVAVRLINLLFPFYFMWGL